MAKVAWDIKRTQFLGRNGYFQCSGFELERMKFIIPKGEKDPFEKDVVRVYPITTKELKGRCFIEIPTRWVGLFAKALEAESNVRGKVIK